MFQARDVIFSRIDTLERLAGVVGDAEPVARAAIAAAKSALESALADIDAEAEQQDPEAEPDGPAAEAAGEEETVATETGGAEAAPAPAAVASPVWTPEREALLRRMWEGEAADADAILTAVNELPGEPVASVHAVRRQAGKLGLRRPPAFLAERAPRAGAAGGAAVRALAASGEKKRGGAPGGDAHWTKRMTPEQRIALRDRLNAAKARQRAAGDTAAAIASPAPAAPAQVPTVVDRAPKQGRERQDDPPARGDAAPPDARDELEAKVLLRAGKSAREIAEDFGVGLNIASRWASEVAAEREAGRAAA